MKRLLLGCPWGSLSSLKRLSDEFGVAVYDASQIAELHGGTIIFDGGERLDVSKFDGAYIRYPYDLLPEFTKNFADRERIEFFKSVALAVQDISIVPVSIGWALRSRIYSLALAAKYGARVPDSIASSRCDISNLPDDHRVMKALGNCFVSESAQEATHLSYETELDGDQAYIFPTQAVTPGTLQQHQKLSSVVFTQKAIPNEEEYRCYITAETLHAFRRVCDEPCHDKSGCACERVDSIPTALVRDGFGPLRNMCNDLGVAYICFDAVCSPKCGQFYILDINPFGSILSVGDDSYLSRSLFKAVLGA